ncbi:MAG TPA: L,D-transpeptidase family protein [Stellaceae bacterium]|nr:L,D-transpeptidase family protein [Stellaceae bacterium]
MDLIVAGPGTALWGGRAMRCALGRAGVAALKHEGDHATPSGAFVMRRALYRPDREPPPPTRLGLALIAAHDGWCDDPADPAYNRPVRLPHGASAEAMWRADRLYDLLVVLGFNDAPVVPGIGSAIFLHLAAADFAPTEGCIALSRDDLLAVLAGADGTSRVVVPLSF